MTDAENIEALDGQLNASLAVFDGMILGERAAAAAIANSDPGAMGGGGVESDDGDPSGGGASGPLFEEGDLSEAGGPGGMGGLGTGGGEGDEDGSGDQQGTVAAMPSGGSGLPGRGKGDGTVPPDLVDGSDDDIVARQIREAAMAEKDPALREKLWEEYRKYKKGS